MELAKVWSVQVWVRMLAQGEMIPDTSGWVLATALLPKDGYKPVPPGFRFFGLKTLLDKIPESL